MRVDSCIAIYILHWNWAFGIRFFSFPFLFDSSARQMVCNSDKESEGLPRSFIFNLHSKRIFLFRKIAKGVTGR